MHALPFAGWELHPSFAAPVPSTDGEVQGRRLTSHLAKPFLLPTLTARLQGEGLNRMRLGVKCMSAANSSGASWGLMTLVHHADKFDKHCMTLPCYP